jgi:hypothetical protein
VGVTLERGGWITLLASLVHRILFRHCLCSAGPVLVLVVVSPSSQKNMQKTPTLAQESASQSRIATEWVAEDGSLHSNQVRGVRTSKLSNMGLPVPELVPVPVLCCPVPVLEICAFGYLHIYVGTQTRKLPILVRGSAIPVLVPILKLTSVHFLNRNFSKVR